MVGNKKHEKRKPKKLGESTSVTVGGKRYVSGQVKQKQQTKPTTNTGTVRSSKKKVTPNTSGTGDSGATSGTVSSSGETINNRKVRTEPNIKKTSEAKEQARQSVVKQSSAIVTPQTTVNKKTVQSSYRIHSYDDKQTMKNSVFQKKNNNGNTTGATSGSGSSGRPVYLNRNKTKISTTEKVTRDSEVRQQAIKSVKRQSSITVTPQTIISKKKVQTGYHPLTSNMKPSSSGTGVSTRPVIKTEVSITQNVKTNETEQQVKRNVQRQSSITVTPQTVISKPKVQTGYRINNANMNMLTRAKNKAQNALDAQDDSGSQTLSNAITTGTVTVKVFKTAQQASPHVIKGAKGVYHVGQKTVRIVHRVDSTVGMIKTGAIKLDKDTAMRIKSMAVYKLKCTRPAQTLIHAVTGVKTAVNTAKHYSLKVGYGVQRAVILTRGVALGTVKVQITKDTLNRIKKATAKGAIKGIKITGKAIGYTVKTGTVGVVKGGIKVGKGLNRGLLSAGDMFTNTDDMGTQALGYGMKATHYTVKAIATTPKVAKATYKGIKTGVNTMVKTGKYTVRTYRNVKSTVATSKKIAKKLGKKQTAKLYAKRWGKSLRGKATKAVQKAGSSIVSALIEGVKKIGSQFILPLILIIVVVACVASVIMSGGAVIGSILSPFSSDDKGEEVDESEWLTAHITTKRNELVADIKDTYNKSLKANGGIYDCVRFYDTSTESEKELSDTNIDSSIYTVAEYQQYIQPIFHTLILSEYEMEASESEMQEILDEIWLKISSIKTEELPTEYCHMEKQSSSDGTYTITPVKDKDGLVHADLSICPNYSVIKLHPDDTKTELSSCDYWYYICKGHKGECSHTCNNDCGCGSHVCGSDCADGCIHVCTTTCVKKCTHEHEEWKSADESGCYSTTYHEGKLDNNCGNATKHKGCNGYNECNGHKVLSVSVEVETFSTLLDQYYVSKINDLESKDKLSDEEKKELQSLKDYYDICVSYVEVIQDEIGFGDGGGGTVVDLDDVTLTDVTSYACSFVGNPYVWGGNDPHTGADCSGFVDYVYTHFGVNLPRTSKEQVKCGTLITSLSQAEAGDLLFFSRTGTDQGVYHVGMYLGNNKYVHASNGKAYPVGGIKVSSTQGKNIYKIKRIAK